MARKIGMSRPDKSQDPMRREGYFGPGEKRLWEGAPAGGIRYALANTRAFNASTTFGRNLDSYPAGSDAPPEPFNGSLDTVNCAISAAETAEILMGPQRRATQQNTRPVGFRLLKDGRTVFNLLAEIRKENP